MRGGTGARGRTPRPAVVLFTRDLRVHDNPALVAATEAAPSIVPLFVLDDEILREFGAPNRVAFLEESLRDLAGSLGGLVLRRGQTAREALDVARKFGADRVFVAEDASAFAQRRERDLRSVLQVETFSSTSIVPLDALHTYRVFTPYWRAWRQVPRRTQLEPPELRLANDVDKPTIELRAMGTSPKRPLGGERRGRARLEEFIEHGLIGYESLADDLAAAASSRLSPYLHFGCVSPLEVEVRGHESESFVRALCWRDYFLQLLAAEPRIAREDYRPRAAEWGDDSDALAAWQSGRTGCAIVDAAMRQLLDEGWIPNRARLIVGAYLTKTLGVHWRHGAQHFDRWLVDGDVASNSGNWQWVAGTGTDPRRNRRFNPDRQAKRFDPDGAYVRRHAQATSSSGRAAP